MKEQVKHRKEDNNIMYGYDLSKAKNIIELNAIYIRVENSKLDDKAKQKIFARIRKISTRLTPSKEIKKYLKN